MIVFVGRVHELLLLLTYTASKSWFDAARERMFSSDLGSPSSKASMASTSSAAGSVEPTLRIETVELGTR